MQGHVAIAAPEGRRATPNYSLKARVLRIKQTNGLNFSTALPTSPRRLPILPLGLFFMKFRGPQALSNRRRKTIVCATKAVERSCPVALFRAIPRGYSLP
jgi:hypothetical protein